MLAKWQHVKFEKKKATDVEYKFWLLKFEIYKVGLLGSKFNQCLKTCTTVLPQIHTPTMKFASSLLHIFFSWCSLMLSKFFCSKQTRRTRVWSRPWVLASSQTNIKSNTPIETPPLKKQAKLGYLERVMDHTILLFMSRGNKK